ncbi:MAG TPA: AIR synthase-related protein, partial [Tepidisphaeraceae bacterium]
LQQVVAGVRDYGNRMGIPTVNGAVYFDNRYLGNPLVFCGCVGLIPCSQIAKEAMPGDAIVVMGGRTGRDGIHGATFSSAELTDTHADEFSHAVQIGNAITEKKMADVILQARDRGLFTAVTDCGAGGLSSAVGEMGEKIGARVELDKVPLKYAGLRYDEIWISEAQERMVLSVPQDKVAELLALSAGEDVESTVIGQFGTDDAQLILLFGETEVGRIAMHFLHHGIPKPKRKAVVQSAKCKVQSAEGEMLNAECGMMNAELKTQNAEQRTADNGQRTTDTIQHSAFSIQHSSPSLRTRLLSLLSDPNIASKHWIIRQYDHEVQGGSVIKPLIGPLQIGPSDAAVIRPKLDSYRGIAIGCGMAPHIADPYDMAIASIDEAIRNVVAVGADPARIAILDNFCWPSVDDEQTMGTLVRACEACYDAAKAYGIPFISGKDSLHNQFTNHETGEVLRIPNTLLISAIAVLEDVRKCITMDMKEEWERLVLVRPQGTTLADLARAHRAVAALIAAGLVRACHDVSDGGILVAIAEMSIASGFGATLPLSTLPAGIDPFAELLGAYILSVHRRDVKDVLDRAAGQAEVKIIGDGSPAPQFNAYTRKDSCELSIEDLTRAWRGTLDW